VRLAYEPVEVPFDASVAEHCPGDPRAAEALGDALEAAAVTVALIQGRSALGQAPA